MPINIFVKIRAYSKVSLLVKQNTHKSNWSSCTAAGSDYFVCTVIHINNGNDIEFIYLFKFISHICGYKDSQITNSPYMQTNTVHKNSSEFVDEHKCKW